MSSIEQKFLSTSGVTDPVWIHTHPYKDRPQFKKLNQDLDTDVCVIGSGIGGISTAYELVKKGLDVVMLEAREVLSGETGRTSGHLASALDDKYIQIAKKHGEDKAKLAAESHIWALNNVGEVSKELGIECEYRHLPGYEISQHPHGTKEHDEDVKDIKSEVDKANAVGLNATYREGYAVKGWDGKIDQRDAGVYADQATFHPTKYVVGVLEWLTKQPNFKCYTHSRVMEVKERGIEILGFGSKDVHISTEDGHSVTAKFAVQATCVPLQKLSVVAEMEFHRTYCIAIRIPKGSVEDCLLYDSNEVYKYIRMTECDEKDDYMVVGGCDHKVGQKDNENEQFRELEEWTRERFTHAGNVDYKWSGQVYEPVDNVAFIGKNPGNKHTFIITGDSGNGLTHGVLAGRLIADEITGTKNKWASVYDPSRMASILKSAPSMLSHDLQINSQYKRLLQSDITDIEDLAPGTGGVLNSATQKPLAVYKDDDGQVSKMSAFCPHLKGVVAWNHAEKSWDCPVHGSRFSPKGICVIGPSKGNLPSAD